MPTGHEKLSRREREIIYALFSLGDAASAEDIRTQLTATPSYSAVRAMLAKLEAKGFIKHREEQFRYVYSPVTSRSTARREALQELVRVYFHDSPGEAAGTLLKSQDWSDEELVALSTEVQRILRARRA
jgi:BlaI family transcriptional regulator, penicillinase repressor